jgi:co-chaperonin GroES (HSP10)
MNLSVGAQVFLPEFGGTKLQTEDGEPELILYREDDILATVNDA